MSNVPPSEWIDFLHAVAILGAVQQTYVMKRRTAAYKKENRRDDAFLDVPYQLDLRHRARNQHEMHSGQQSSHLICELREMSEWCKQRNRKDTDREEIVIEQNDESDDWGGSGRSQQPSILISNA